MKNDIFESFINKNKKNKMSCKEASNKRHLKKYYS